MAPEPAELAGLTRAELIERVCQLEAQVAGLSIASGTDVSTAKPSAVRPYPDESHLHSALDPDKYGTRLIAMKIAYLGQNYCGLQASPQAKTIEGELWRALVKARLAVIPKDDCGPRDLLDENKPLFGLINMTKCGRTDRGVSAFGQVIGLRVRSNGGPELNDKSPDEQFPVETELPYCDSLNRLLPPEIRALAWSPFVPSDFSARKFCCERRYRYYFTQPAYAVGRGSDNASVETVRLDIPAMRETCGLFVGTHDFRNFCCHDKSKFMTRFVRTIFSADIIEVGKRRGGDEGGYTVYAFDIRGSAFLWHQIRCMVAVMFLVGQGLEDRSVISDLLDVEKHPCRPQYQLAAPEPLVLWDCIYPDLSHGGPAFRDEDRVSDGDAAEIALQANQSVQGFEDAFVWVRAADEYRSVCSPRGNLDRAVWDKWRSHQLDAVLAEDLMNMVFSSRQSLSFRQDCLPDRTALGRKDTRLSYTTQAQAGENGFQLHHQPSKKRLAKADKPGKPIRRFVFNGSGTPLYVGKAYIPLLELKTCADPIVTADNYAKHLGFDGVEHLRSLPNWNLVFLEAKKSGIKKRDKPADMQDQCNKRSRSERAEGASK